MRKSWSRAIFITSCILFFITISWSAHAFELKAGTARARITPDNFKGRVAVMGNKIRTVEHDIFARALVLDDGSRRMVIVTYDLNCLDVATPILRVRYRDELGIDPAFLLLLATHNHAAPIQIAPDNFDYGRWLAGRIFDLIEEAIADESGPARLYFGSGRAAIVRADPRYPDVYGWRGRPIDDEVQVLKVMAGGKVKAVLFNQPTHPLQNSFLNIEVGHPGYAVEYVEDQYPDALAMYADACGADQMVRAPFIMWGPLGEVKRAGRQLAEAVIDVSGGLMQEVTGPLKSSLEVIALPLAPPMSYDDAKELAAKERAPLDIGFVPYPDPDRESNWIRALLMHYEQGIAFPATTKDRVCTDDGFLVRELSEPREFPCVYEETIAAAIGPMALVAMQGEVCAPIGLRVKNEFRDQMPIMVFAYMGEHNLYIPTRELVQRDAYQSRVIRIQYASPVGWSPRVEDVMGSSVIRMVESVMGK